MLIEMEEKTLNSFCYAKVKGIKVQITHTCHSGGNFMATW